MPDKVVLNVTYTFTTSFKATRLLQFTLFHILGFLSNIKIKSISFKRSFRSLTYYSPQ